jgi:competence protein ComEC
MFSAKLYLCLIAFIAGILFPMQWMWTQLSVLVLLGLVILSNRPAISGLGFNLLVVSSFYALGVLNKEYAEAIAPEEIPEKGTALVLVQEVKRSQTSTRAECRLLVTERAAKWEALNHGLLLYAPAGDTAICPGAVLTFDSKIRSIENLEQFDFDLKTHWARKGIHHQSFIREYTVVGTWRSWWSDLDRSRRDLQERLSNGLSEKQFALASAIVLGDKSGLSEEVKEDFRRAGLMHIMAVSGMHIGFVFLILRWMFFVFRNLAAHPYIEFALVLLGIWSYALLTGASVSVLRASSMLSMYLLINLFGRKTEGLHILGLSAFLILSIDPMQVHALGFQLSFSALLGIMLFFQPIQKLFHTKWRLLQYAWDLSVLSITAQLGTTALVVYHFATFASLSLLSNLLVSPALIFLMVFSFLSFLSIPHVGEWLTFALRLSLDYLIWVSEFVSQISWSQVQCDLSWQSALVLCMSILLLLPVFRANRWRFLFPVAATLLLQQYLSSI